MKEADTTSDMPLKGLPDKRKQLLRKNIYILFLGLVEEETDAIIALLRGARLAPRGRPLSTEEEFINALRERSWDLMICTSERDDLLIRQAMQHLKRLDKDIPVIQLAPNYNYRLLLQGLKANMQAVVPLDEKELLLKTIRIELDHLENRRRMRLAESQLTEAEKRERLLVEHSTLAIGYLDKKILLQANNAFAQLFGYDSPESLKGKLINQFIEPKETNELDEQLQRFSEENLKELNVQFSGYRADESSFSADIQVQEAYINNKSCIQVTVRGESLAQSKIQFSEHDPITGLYNADFFQRRLDETIQAAQLGGHDCHLFYIYLNNHSKIRATHGSDSCDHIARDLADLIKKHINTVHIKARLTDDAFSVIFQDASPEKAALIAEKLCTAITEQQSTLTNNKLLMTCSIGIVTITDTSPGKVELIERAKKTAESLTPDGNHVMFYTSDSSTTESDDADTIATLKTAIQKQNFKLLFQPIVALSYTSQLSHYEALFKLLDKEQNELSYCASLGNVEIAKLSITMDRWAMQQSIHQLRQELDTGNSHRLFISVSKKTLGDPSVLEWLAKQLREFRIPADHLVFQISESDCSSYLARAQAFAVGLKKLNCLICIQHYGCSSNASQVLRHINADYIKLDGSFIEDLATADALDVTFETMVEALNAQGKITIAPLVEDPKIMSRLWKSGVGLIQGHYLQRPREKMDYDFFEGQ